MLRRIFGPRKDVDRRWHSSVLDVRSFRGVDCDTDCKG